MLLLSVLMLGSVHPQAAAAARPPVATTEVMVTLTVKPENRAKPEFNKIMPEEARQTMLLYLSGKIDQWYSRIDGKGVVFLMHCSSVEEAKSLMEGLPLDKAGLADLDYVPLGPLQPMRLLTTPAMTPPAK